MSHYGNLFYERKRIREDYFKGVAPSDLARLDNRQLFLAAMRLHETVSQNIGTPEEQAKAAEALQEVYREKNRRRATLRDGKTGRI